MFDAATFPQGAKLAYFRMSSGNCLTTKSARHKYSLPPLEVLLMCTLSSVVAARDSVLGRVTGVRHPAASGSLGARCRIIRTQATGTTARPSNEARLHLRACVGPEALTLCKN